MKLNTTIFAIVISWFSVQAWAVDSHCAEDETIVFNCSTGKKVVSVCASKAISASTGYVQYRFGKLESPELILPATKSPPTADIQANSLTFAGGGGAYIRFKRDEHSYVVYTAIGRGWGEKAGVAVEINQQLQANLTCKKSVLSELGPDFFEQAGIKTDSAGFDIP